MAAVNDPNFFAKRDQERRAVADQIAAGQAHRAFQDRRAAQSRAWQRQVAEVAYQRNHRPRPSTPYPPADSDGFGWVLCGAAAVVGLCWLLGKARGADPAGKPHPQPGRPESKGQVSR